MAATTRFAAAISVLSVLSAVSGSPFPDYPACKPTTKTVYTTITVPDSWKETAAPVAAAKPTTKAAAAAAAPASQQYSPSASWSYPGVSFPTFSPEKPNPNGPFYNPNNWLPQPIVWPGKATKGQTTAPDIPTGLPKPHGGYSSGDYQEPAWLPHGVSGLKPGLSQQDTNGDSQWGLIDCPRLPPYLGPEGGSVSASTTSSGWTATSSYGPTGVPSVTSKGFPSYSYSGNYSKTASSSSYSLSSSSFSDKCVGNDTEAACGKMPNTGVVRHYEFSLSYGVLAPDGVKKNGLLVNGQFPGPLIEANWGDWIEVKVTNNLPEDAGDQGEGTALHWHGFLQQETPFYDGVPSVQQCPIAPGKTVVYKFRADHFGTSWYHSHYSAQYAGGASGPIVIHGPATACYDEDIGPVIVSDWYHKDYFSVLSDVMNGSIPLSNNQLIQGKMNYPCDNTTFECTPNAGVAKFSFKAGKKYRLRLINTSAEATQKFTIDGHNFTVFANDFMPVKPYSTSVVTLGVGQRTDVVVEAVGKSGDAYWMRSEAGNIPARSGCSFNTGVSTQAVAAVYYDGADTTVAPTTVSGLSAADKNNCDGDPLSITQALCAVPVDDDYTLETYTFSFHPNSTGTVIWYVNNQTFRANMNVNLLENVIAGNDTFDAEWNVKSIDQTKKAVRIHMINTFQASHPMHLHGHDFNVLASGHGTWDGTIVNPDNTQIRDVHILPGSNPVTGVPSYTVIQFNQDNPGVWPLHCHIAWHVSQGLYVNVLEKKDSIHYNIPPGIKQTCVDWDAWSTHNIVNQIDSGV